jgi:hypothetical protein
MKDKIWCSSVAGASSESWILAATVQKSNDAISEE